MPVTLDQFIDPLLPAAESEEAYELYRAALEWQLSSPIVIRSGKEILSTDRWKNQVEPFQHQVRNLITFCRLAPAVLLADEVGLGKTISAGLILSELIVRRRVARTLVICPRVLCEQWVQELADKFRIEATPATGNAFVKACGEESPVVVTTYETIGRYLNHPDVPTDAFQLLILDEAHRLRNLHGANSPPQFATAIQEAMAARWFTYVLMLTATPIQNRFSDIYSLIDLLTLAKGHRNPFGDWNDFRNSYLLPGSDGRRLRPNMSNQFRQVLNGYVARTRRVDADLPFPTRHVETVRVTLNQGENELQKLVASVADGLKSLELSSLGEALMSSPVALAAQFEHMTGTRPWLVTAASQARAIAKAATPPAKLAKLFTVCEQLRSARPDWRVVVFTRRRETQGMIRQGLVARGIPVGLIVGGEPVNNRRDTQDFLAEPPRLHVLVSTDAGAEGVNLQKANWLVNYDLPWNPMVLEQRIGRVQRLGSAHKEVIVQNFVAAGTVEERVVARLMQRLLMVTETVGDLESILEAAGESEDEPGKKFEARVRELVVQSIQGQNPDEAAAKQEASIERAKREYDTNCRQMNQDLGALDASGNPGPAPPEFERKAPSLSADKLVCRALAVEGKKLREILPGLVEVTAGTTTAKIALSPEAAEVHCVPGPDRYYPGQRRFDRLIEQWAGRRSHHVLDLRGATQEATERLARDWCGRYPEASFNTYSIRSCKRHINGRVLVRTTAENRLDEHERLIEHSVAPYGHPQPPKAALGSAFGDEVSLQQIAPHATVRVRQTVARDEEVNKFAQYYLSRRTNELSRAGANPHLRKRVEDDFTVTVKGEVVGFRGVCYEEVILDVRFTVRGGEYAATLQAVPALGTIIEQPTEERCPITGLLMPVGVLGLCQRSGRLIPEHLLFQSAVSRRRAVQEFLVRCDLTDLPVLDDEVEVCAVTHKRAISSEFVTCRVSNDRILRSIAGMSAVSEVTVRQDLLFPSDKPPHRLGLANERVQCSVSGRMLLCDEAGASALSGRITDLAFLVASERSGRLGLTDEMVRCHQTQRLLLRDEIGVCSVSGKQVELTLLLRSELSHQFALPEHCGRCGVTNRVALLGELERCQRTGQLVLPDQLETCVVSGERMIRGMMLACAVTGVWLSPSVAIVSDVSGRSAHPAQICRSQRPPHRAGLPDEVGVCEFSNKTLLLIEMARSVVSNQLMDRDLLQPSEKGGGLALESELVRCEESGMRVLPAETGMCAATGKRVCCDLLEESPYTHQFYLKRFFVTCPVSGKRFPKQEAEVCELSGEDIARGVLVRCSVTGKRANPRLLQRCSDSGELVVPSEIGFSDYRCRPVKRCLLRASEKTPGRLGTGEEFGLCEVSGKQLLLDELNRCAISKKLVDSDLLVTCAPNGDRVIKAASVRCAWVGKRVLRKSSAGCKLTYLIVLKEFLDGKGHFLPLAEMLRGLYTAEVEERNDLIPILREIDPKLFAGLEKVLAVQSPAKNRLAVCATLTERSGLRSTKKYAGFILATEPHPRIWGRLVLGRRVDGYPWKLERAVMFQKQA